MPKRLTTEEYKNFLKQNHPTIILLSEYCGDKNYITVKCCVCGHEWRTKPVWIRQGKGCKNCFNLRRGDATRKTQEEFIESAKHIHCGKYQYEKVIYENDAKKVIITCPIHGDFKQTPNKHLQGQGCPKCSAIKNGLSKRIGLEEFIERAKSVHGERYEYFDNVEYINCDTKIPIKCKKHGVFMQRPYQHLTGGGCPICRSSHMEEKLEKILKEMKIEHEGQKRFKWLGKQSLDFYLPSLNIAIECQGLQHFRKIYSRRKDDTFLTKQYDIIKERDMIKKRLCEENGIQMLYVTNLPKKDSMFSDSVIYTKENLFFDFNSLCEKLSK